jgi:GNAT superfamily N-acetyltransferase
MTYKIRPINDQDRDWVQTFVSERWSGESVVVHGSEYLPHKLSGFIAATGALKPVGLVTYLVENSECEIITLNSLMEGEGIGSALVQAVQGEATRLGCRRTWCITTNDNFPALIFYQKRGFRIVRVYPGAVERARVIKPSIPLFGLESIPIRDEIELQIENVTDSISDEGAGMPSRW